MVGITTRQWYRMSATEALDALEIDPMKGVTNTTARQSNAPYFLHKQSWHLYRYSVLRNGVHQKVAIDQIVIGDIITLHVGDIAPANLRLLKARSLSVKEDHVTGSAAYVHKYTFASKSLLPKSQQKNMVFTGSQVLEGVAVGLVVELAQHTKIAKAKQVRSSFSRRGIVVQSTGAIKKLQHANCVVIDDLQQESEIISLVQKVYLEKSISCVFFVTTGIAEHIKKYLPENTIQDAANFTTVKDIAVYTNASDSQKAKILATYKKLGARVLYIHRGEHSQLYTKIADLTLVVSSTALQAAMYAADLVAPRISISSLTSILHNNK